MKNEEIIQKKISDQVSCALNDIIEKISGKEHENLLNFLLTAVL